MEVQQQVRGRRRQLPAQQVDLNDVQEVEARKAPPEERRSDVHNDRQQRGSQPRPHHRGDIPRQGDHNHRRGAQPPGQAGPQLRPDPRVRGLGGEQGQGSHNEDAGAGLRREAEPPEDRRGS